MRASYDVKLEAVELCKSHSAGVVKEMLGLDESVRTIQRWANQVLGKRPTYRQLRSRDVLRDAVVAYMKSSGLDDRYCSVCLRMSFKPCYIRQLDRGVGGLVFVCGKCRQAGDV